MMPVSFMELQRTRSMSVAWGCLMSFSIRSSLVMAYPSAGEGAPACNVAGGLHP
jgi:hypothetical protein